MSLSLSLQFYINFLLKVLRGFHLDSLNIFIYFMKLLLYFLIPLKWSCNLAVSSVFPSSAPSLLPSPFYSPLKFVSIKLLHWRLRELCWREGRSFVLYVYTVTSSLYFMAFLIVWMSRSGPLHSDLLSGCVSSLGPFPSLKFILFVLSYQNLLFLFYLIILCFLLSLISLLVFQ